MITFKSVQATGGTPKVIRYQGDYIVELIADTDYPNFDIELINQAFFEWLEHKKQGIMTFRDNIYKSPMTSNMSTPHHTAWMEALGDSLECYLQESK